MSREDCIVNIAAIDRKVDSPQEIATKLKLASVLQTCVELEDGQIDFNLAALECLESETSAQEIRSLVDGASHLASIHQKTVKNKDDKEEYAKLSRQLSALAELYVEPAPRRKGPNNPYSMPIDHGVSLSRVGDAMRNRRGRGR